MGPPLRQADYDGLEAYPIPSSSDISRTEVNDITSMMRAGAKTSQYSHILASDQARQHIGDSFYAPVTFQHAAPAPVAATVPARGAERESLMESLVFKEMDARFVDVHPHLVGTCEWLLETPEYKKWINPEFMSKHHGFFWIKGKAGAGKSTLMKHAFTYADRRCSARQHVLNFFFHARGGSFEVSTDGLFRSLLHQLLEKIPVAYGSINKRRLGIVQRQGWSSTLLQDTFREAVLSLDQDQLFCFIDAMDECRHDDIEGIIQYFDNLGDALVAKGKVFYLCLSSRHYPNLKSSKSVQLVLDSQDGHDKDIRKYIRQRLMIDAKTLKRNLAEAIRSKAYGVFLWVVLVVALVNQDDRNGNAAEIYQRLKQIPTGLSDLFNELIGRGTNSDHFRPLLQWVAFSERPLKLTDLYCILMHGIAKTVLRPPTLSKKNLAKFILSASKGLVETTAGRSPRVQFIHESLRTYFLGKGVVHLIDNTVIDRIRSNSVQFGVQESVAMTAHCHDQLKERCLAYVVQVIKVIDPQWLKPTVVLTERNSEQRDQILTAYPFINHAVDGVMDYANTALDLGSTQHAFMDALPLRELDILHTIVNSRYLGSYQPFTTEPWYKGYVAAKFRCPKILKAVLEAHTPSEANSKQWAAILSASIDASDEECVSIALQAVGDPNVPLPIRFGQYLHPALVHVSETITMDRVRVFGNIVRMGSMRPQGRCILELLLKHGANPYATIKGMQDCLHFACLNDDLDLARILLGKHLKADTQCSNYGISLARAVGQASHRGSDEMLRFLLDKGAETGWWPRAKLNTHASLEVAFGNMLPIRLILAEDPQVVPSSGTVRDLTLRFSLIPRPDHRQEEKTTQPSAKLDLEIDPCAPHIHRDVSRHRGSLRDLRLASQLSPLQDWRPRFRT